MGSHPGRAFSCCVKRLARSPGGEPLAAAQRVSAPIVAAAKDRRALHNHLGNC